MFTCNNLSLKLFSGAINKMFTHQSERVPAWTQVKNTLNLITGNCPHGTWNANLVLKTSGWQYFKIFQYFESFIGEKFNIISYFDWPMFSLILCWINNLTHMSWDFSFVRRETGIIFLYESINYMVYIHKNWWRQVKSLYFSDYCCMYILFKSIRVRDSEHLAEVVKGSLLELKLPLLLWSRRFQP